MQWKAIRAILPHLAQCPEVKAVFLKGSLASGTDDRYSDVDLYCLVEEGGMGRFLERREGILEQYRPLIFTSEANFVGPQMVAVFDNGLHLDLYAVTTSTFPHVGQMKPLHDPDGLLQRFMGEAKDHSLPWEAVERSFASFSFSLLEFEAAWGRGDIAWSIRLASHLAGDLGIVLRRLYDPANAQLGTKRLEAVMPQGVRDQLRWALRLSGEDTLRGVLALSEIMGNAVRELEEDQGRTMDHRLYRFMVERLRAEI